MSAAAVQGKPLVVAHRGASGYLPEHTLAAKALAHSQRADFLEQDTILTRDDQVIVCHDIYLERVTDVRDRYPGRAREDGHYYAIDFDWHEIRELALRDPDGRALSLPLVSDLDRGAARRICTLAEEIGFVRELNERSGRLTGIYVEIKKPRWHRDHGHDLSAAVLGVLANHGYGRADDPAFVQCFDPFELRRVREELGCSLRLVQLVGRSSPPELLAAAGLGRVAEYATALGPNYRQLLTVSAGREPALTPLGAEARRVGLPLHPYTFNRIDMPAFAETLEDLLAIAYDLIEPEAVFCDYPDVAVRVRDYVWSARGQPKSDGLE